MNAKKYAELAREHHDNGNATMAVKRLIDAVAALADAEPVNVPDSSTWLNVRMTAEDAAVYAEAKKTIALILAKYGAVTV